MKQYTILLLTILFIFSFASFADHGDMNVWHCKMNVVEKCHQEYSFCFDDASIAYSDSPLTNTILFAILFRRIEECQNNSEGCKVNGYNHCEECEANGYKGCKNDLYN